MVGRLYPMLINSKDRVLVITDNDDTQQKSQICKSLIMFVGINHLCAVCSLAKQTNDLLLL